jgi:hypothetical protein
MVAQLGALAVIFVFLAFGNAALCLFVATGLGFLTALYLVLGFSTMGLGTFYNRKTDPKGYWSSIRTTILAFVAALAVAIYKVEIR